MIAAAMLMTAAGAAKANVTLTPGGGYVGFFGNKTGVLCYWTKQPQPATLEDFSWGDVVWTPGKELPVNDHGAKLKRCYELVPSK